MTIKNETILDDAIHINAPAARKLPLNSSRCWPGYDGLVGDPSRLG